MGLWGGVGRLAAFEPDWTGLALAGASAEVTARVLEARASTIASPDVGARLPHLLAEAGFRDLRSGEVALAISALEVALRALRLVASVEAAVAAGTVSPSNATAWLQMLSAAEQGGSLLVRITGHLVSGTRSASAVTKSSAMGSSAGEPDVRRR